MSNSVQLADKTFSMYIPQEEIELRISGMARKIGQKYSNGCPMFIVLLNGAFMFAGEFFKSYPHPCEVEFVKLTSYIGTESSGEIITCIGITEEQVKGRDIIILEDIIDTGLTMDFFVDYLQQLNPHSIQIATLFFKPSNLKKDINLHYYGFSIDPEFIVGYGLDYNGLGRNLTSIYKIVNAQ